MPDRHDLVWLHPEAWRRLRRAAPYAQAQAMDRWSSADWPATVRRQDADTGPDEICLGITLPCDSPAGSRIRVALRCRQADIRHAIRPIHLDAVDIALLRRWAGAWREWRRGVTEAGLEVRVYGSLGMEALTGQPYLTGNSDIDLLFFPASLEQLRAGAALFDACLDRLPLDGEVVFPSGRAVAWKEWCRASSQDGRDRVLVKQINRVSLCTAAELQAELAEAACAR